MGNGFFPEENDGFSGGGTADAPGEDSVCTAYHGRENYFHAHDRLQIGICRGGSGTVRIKDEIYDYGLNTVLVVPVGSRSCAWK